MMINEKEISVISNNVINYASLNQYSGYNKFDGLTSPITKILSFNNKWARLFWSQMVMRAPLNIRPLLGIKKTRNPKGIALFAWAYLNFFKITNDEQFLDQAKSLLDWLSKNQSPGFDNPCWGYQYAWQDIGFFAPANYPNRIVTYFVCRAFLRGYEITGNPEYFDIVRKSADFILNAPRVLFESDTMKCLSYVPSEKIDWVVMDVSALSSVILAMVAREMGDNNLKEEAKKLIHYVVDKQTDYGAWYYSHPSKDSHIGHDNYHTGYIVDAIQDYMDSTGDREYEAVHEKGLQFYAEHLFMKNGAPKWMSQKEYPFDIHGAAQGIITFSRYPEYHELAGKVLEWTLNNLYNQKGYFYYQKRRFFTKRFTLMRWCNGWMLLALTCFLLQKKSI